ncbi:hypothetical protein CSKR_114426 [Clonorchis sinensis]|uniref:Major facilitator superfamily (MFS) profile domain-containing protein n=1 Tax=Clonorchis sinensis TaxID=79923 RepID=A0A3R7JKI1_CLOSI|nr:hypothetical protein CSKR_114426 [Clonorchis sinensis]
MLPINEPANVRESNCPKSACSPKTLQVFVATTWGFLTNVERAIIMPSLWLYLKTEWDESAAKKFYAATVAVFCLAILVFTPFVGYAAYKGVRTQIILIVSNQLEILGNIMYLVGRSPWVLLFGRLISGLGACCDSPLYSDMVKLTDERERTFYVIALLLPRQAGLLFGPTFTLIVHRLDVNVGNFNINVYNVPGLLMASLWGVHCILTLLTYPDMERTINPTQTPDPQPTLAKRLQRMFYVPREPRIKKAVTDQLSSSKQPPGDVFTGKLEHKTNCSPCCARDRQCLHYLPYFNLSLIALFGITFFIYYSLMGLEAVLPPVTEVLYQWTEVEVSIVYLVAGGAVIVTFIIYQCITQCIRDRKVLAVGLSLLFLAYLALSCHLAHKPTPDKSIGIPIILCAVALHVIGVPLAAASSESLYTKLVPRAEVERGQTIFRTVQNLGFFAGPFICGSLVDTPYIAFLIMMLLVYVPFVMFWIDYHTFRMTEDESMKIQDV